jgi:hypothetical protein
MARTNPRRDKTFIVKPSIGKRIKAPTSETGMARVGIRVALQSCMNINTTRITSNNAIIRVTIISLIPAVMAVVVSRET